MNESIGTIIMRLRKEHGMTQEQLASALGITFQAVSKWENGISSPDLSALPLLADLFDVTVDQLLGRQPLELSPEESGSKALEPMAAASLEKLPVLTLEPIPEPILEPILEKIPEPPRKNEPVSGAFPWEDDGNFYAVLFRGHELVGYLAGDPALEQAKKHFVFEFKGNPKNIHSDFSVNVDGDVEGSVSAGENVNCGDVDGDVIAGTAVNCGDVDGDLSAGTGVKCSDVEGNVRAGGSVRCADVEGSVSAGGNVSCGDVEGSVAAGGSVNCGEAGGNSGVRISLSEDEDDEDDDDEGGASFTFDMGDFGEKLGRQISEAVEKATRFGMKFKKMWQDQQEQQDRDEE